MEQHKVRFCSHSNDSSAEMQHTGEPCTAVLLHLLFMMQQFTVIAMSILVLSSSPLPEPSRSPLGGCGCLVKQHKV